MRIIVTLFLLLITLNAYSIKNSDGDVIFYIGGNNNDRVSINCGEVVDEDYALKVCGKVLANDFVKDTINLDFKDSDDSLDGNETESDHQINFTMVLNKASSEDITFHFETKDDSAVDGEDYNKVDKDVTISAGDTEVDVSIEILGDTKAENDERFDVEITKVTNNFDIVDSTGTYTIKNDDEAPKIELLESDKSATEGDTFTIKASLDRAAVGDIKVKWIIVHDTTNDNDFDDLNGEFTISDGDTETTFDVKTKSDNNYGEDERFIVRLDSVTDGDGVIGDDKDQAITITNDDDKPNATIDDQEVDETDDDQDVDFTISLDVAPETKVSLTAEIEHDTTDDDDLDPDAGVESKIEFDEGEDSKTYTVTVKGDNDSEDDETYYIKLKNQDNLNISDDTGDGKINDDDGGMWSDRRLKQNIKNINKPLQSLQHINGVTFNWKDKKRFGSQEEVGVIAQDVEKVYPQIIVTDKQGYKKVKYHLLVAPLIEAVKELKKENEALRKRVEALENAKK